MNVLERSKFRAAVVEATLEELREYTGRIPRGDISESRVKDAIRKLIRIYEAEIGKKSNEDGGYTLAVEWLQSCLKDKEFIEQEATRYSY